MEKSRRPAGPLMPMILARLLIAVPFLCSAADVPVDPPSLPADVRSLVDRVPSVPAEFSADILIRVAGLEKLERSSRIRLLEDAFRQALQAQQPFRRRPALLRPDGSTGFLERAYSQELDGMTLEMRAIEALLPLDPAKARALFTELPLPKLPRLECGDLLTYDVSRFYPVLSKIAAGTFSPKEIQAEESFKFLTRYASLTSPAQIGPMAEVIATAKLSDSQFQGLVATFSSSVKQLSADDRAFTAARPYAVQIRILKQAIEKRGLNPAPLIEAYRMYLVRHLTAVRCADTAQGGAQVTLETIPTEVSEMQMAMNAGAYFNDSLRIDPIQPLSMEEQTPSKTDGEVKGPKGCGGPECQAVVIGYRSLIMKEGGIPILPADRAATDWQDRLRGLLNSLAEWKQDAAATAAEHFRFKVSLYSDLLGITPPGPNRDLVLRATHDYLRGSRLEIENRLEWFLPANILLAKVAFDPRGFGKFGDELRGSGDGVISLYAEADRIAPRSPDRVVSLF